MLEETRNGMGTQKTREKGKQERERVRIRYKDDPKITIIAAVAENGCIGAGNTIPWRLKSDLKRFQEYTMNRPMVMGINTFDSLPKLLKGRLTIVLTRNYQKVQDVIDKHKAVTPGLEVPDVVHITSMSELRDAWEAIKAQFPKYDYSELIVAGGAKLYELTFPLCDKVVLTTVVKKPIGDAYFPKVEFSNKKLWKIVDSKEHFKDEFNECNYKFFTIERPSQAKILSFAGKCEISKLDRISTVEVTNGTPNQSPNNGNDSKDLQ